MPQPQLNMIQVHIRIARVFELQDIYYYSMNIHNQFLASVCLSACLAADMNLTMKPPPSPFTSSCIR